MSESILVMEATKYSGTVLCCYQLHGVISPFPPKKSKTQFDVKELKSSPDATDIST